MSKVATLSRLAPAVSQLPVDWYFDEKIFELEKKLIFDAGPGYVGHQLMVPEAGDFRSLEWKDDGQMLRERVNDGVTLLLHERGIPLNAKHRSVRCHAN